MLEDLSLKRYLRKVDFPPKPLAIRMRERAGYRHMAPALWMSSEQPLIPRRQVAMEPEPRVPKGYKNCEPFVGNSRTVQPAATSILLASTSQAISVLGWVYNYRSVHEMAITVAHYYGMEAMCGPPYFSV
jgi:hypothetical protein